MGVREREGERGSSRSLTLTTGVHATRGKIGSASNAASEVRQQLEGNEATCAKQRKTIVNEQVVNVHMNSDLSFIIQGTLAHCVYHAAPSRRSAVLHAD